MIHIISVSDTDILHIPKVMFAVPGASEKLLKPGLISKAVYMEKLDN